MLFTHEEGKGQRLSVYFPQGTSSSTNFRSFSSPHKGSVSRLICCCFCVPGIARMAGRWVGTERRPVGWEVHRKGRQGCVSFLWELRPARPCQQLLLLRHRDDWTSAWVTLTRDLVHPSSGRGPPAVSVQTSAAHPAFFGEFADPWGGEMGSPLQRTISHLYNGSQIFRA